ncbi:protein kinase [Streptomyces sp. NPDC002825]|uniref:protein kinase domain-containing protein n=1 Tax=Streptomyces sp. NPDC002825 TaxID=3154666 RepID=UPI0033233F22
MFAGDAEAAGLTTGGVRAGGARGMGRTDDGGEGTRWPSAIGPYRVIRKLGAGGMGEAFLASSEQDGLVVVKRIRADLAADPVYRARFRREVQAARAVSGDCTPAVVGAAPEAEHPWLATVFVEGTDLQALVSGGAGPLEEGAVRDLAGALATALASLHGVGLVHRDLKPSNVLMTDTGPRVIDFGIAKPLGTASPCSPSRLRRWVPRRTCHPSR